MASQLAIHRSDFPSAGTAPVDLGNIRVVIRMEKVRQNLRRQLGERPTDSDVLSWLGTLGFVPATDGNAWTCNQDSLRWLSDGEIARTERVEPWQTTLEPPSDDWHTARTLWRGLGEKIHAAVDRFARTVPLP